jgi:hypothetical protein
MKFKVPERTVAALIAAAGLVLVAILQFVVPAACGRPWSSKGPPQPPPASTPSGTAPTLTLMSTSGASVTTGQPYTIKVSAEDVDGNLSNVDVNWNDGTAVEHKTVSGSQQFAAFTRSWSVERMIRWSATAYDTTANHSNQLSGTFSVTAVDHAPTLTLTSTGGSRGDRPSILAFNCAALHRVAPFSNPRTFPGRFLYSEQSSSAMPRTPRDPRSRYGTTVTNRVPWRSLPPHLTRQRATQHLPLRSRPQSLPRLPRRGGETVWMVGYGLGVDVESFLKARPLHLRLPEVGRDSCVVGRSWAYGFRSRGPVKRAATARTNGTTPTTRNTASAARRARSSAWNVPLIR